MSTVRAIAVVITDPLEPDTLLVVQRPRDDDELPGVWGLPATTVHPGESEADAAVRLGRDKLGAALTLHELLTEGEQERAAYRLQMRLYAASLAPREPTLPAPGPQPDGATYYIDWRYGPRWALQRGADEGSLCCALALRFLVWWAKA